MLLLRDILTSDPVLALGSPSRIVEKVSCTGAAQALSNDWIAVYQFSEDGAVSNGVEAAINEHCQGGKIIADCVLVELYIIVEDFRFERQLSQRFCDVWGLLLG